INDLTIMVTASSDHGDASELVIFRVLPTATTTTTVPSKTLFGIPEPRDVQGQLVVSGVPKERSGDLGDTSSNPTKGFTHYTLVSLIVMPILGVLCVSSMIVVGLCYCQRVRMRKTLTELEGRPRRYVYK
ncbi:hypothetical protein SK128_020580, partial [Halocaridina rubra]